ncbi:MAG: sugar ABC transporter substrate-binding protein, partial [Eubacteriales bacterium]|nr:sugar ABC transporter substrate-binding protein [Eubacteriales bacterium]
APLQSDSASTLVANTDKVVIALDTDFTSDKKLAFVGTGNKDAAKSGAVAAVEAAKAKGIDKPTVLVVTGVQGDETHEARLRGYRDAIEAAGGQVLEVQYTDTMPDKAAAAMEAVIQKYPNGVDAVLSIADDMALAAAKVIKDSGNTNYADTVLCGFDGNQSAIEAVMDGSLTIDIAQMGYDMGYKAVEAAVTVLEGGSVESFIDSGSKVIDSSNIDEYVSDMKSKGLWE